jgi:hypothetical protein
MAKNKTLPMEFDFKQVDNEKLSKECSAQVAEFCNTLETIGPKHEKKKHLWKQIYENAVIQRRNAYIMFNNLYLEVHSNPDQHAIHGQTLVKYLDKIEKSNDQLIKLSEIMNEALTDDDAREDEELNEDEMYDHLQNLNKTQK